LQNHNIEQQPINNYNIEHKHNRINNSDNKNSKTHFRTKFKHITQPKHSQHNPKLKAFEGDSPVTSAAAQHHRGNNWRVPRCRSTIGPSGSRSPPVQMHHWASGHTFSKPTQCNDIPKITKFQSIYSNTTTTTNTTQTQQKQTQQTQQTQPLQLQLQQQPQPHVQQAPQQQEHQQQLQQPTQIHNNNNNKGGAEPAPLGRGACAPRARSLRPKCNERITQIESGEPYTSVPSRGSTGQPRSFIQNTREISFHKKTCGDQNQPTLTPKPRNTNRGIRNPNTVEIRREKRSNKRRIARRKKRMEGGEDNAIETQRIPQAKAQEPLKLRMKQML
jgi:hypothetical protein